MNNNQLYLFELIQKLQEIQKKYGDYLLITVESTKQDEDFNEYNKTDFIQDLKVEFDNGKRVIRLL
jgi:hypothetical protein